MRFRRAGAGPGDDRSGAGEGDPGREGDHVEAIDPKVPSITFQGPQGWKYSRRILDKNVLKQVKVGDQVDFTWTEAVMIEVAAPKK